MRIRAGNRTYAADLLLVRYNHKCDDFETNKLRYLRASLQKKLDDMTMAPIRQSLAQRTVVVVHNTSQTHLRRAKFFLNDRSWWRGGAPASRCSHGVELCWTLMRCKLQMACSERIVTAPK